MRLAGLSLATLAATAAAGALVVAIAVGTAGSPVAVTIALLVSLLLAGGALAAARAERRWRLAHPRATIQEAGATTAPPRVPDAEDVQRSTSRPTPPPPVALPAPGPPPIPTLPSVPWEPVGVAAAVAAVARELAQEAVERLRAPAAAVLVPLGRKLVPAGSVGDWGFARRLQREAAAAEAGEGEGALPPAGGGGDSDEAAADPPEFPVDDLLPRLLSLYGQPMPLERWRELEDVPPPLLPLVALADRGAGVAVTLRHRRRLTGLWVLARRPRGHPYSDAELGALERLARRAGPALAKAMASSER